MNLPSTRSCGPSRQLFCSSQRRIVAPRRRCRQEPPRALLCSTSPGARRDLCLRRAVAARARADGWRAGRLKSAERSAMRRARRKRRADAHHCAHELSSQAHPGRSRAIRRLGGFSTRSRAQPRFRFRLRWRSTPKARVPIQALAMSANCGHTSQAAGAAGVLGARPQPSHRARPSRPFVGEAHRGESRGLPPRLGKASSCSLPSRRGRDRRLRGAADPLPPRRPPSAARSLDPPRSAPRRRAPPRRQL